MVGTPLIIISTTCHQYSPSNVASSASKSQSSISKRALSVGRTAMPPGKSSLLVLIGLPSSAPGHIQRPNSRDPKTAMMESILMLQSKTSERYSTIHKTHNATWQYTAACGSSSCIGVLARFIYRLNHCTVWSSEFTMV
jgi:hypothetical protein